MTIAGFFFDFHSVLGITALFHLSSNLSKIALFRKGFDKRLVIRIGIPAVAFVIAGAFLSRFMDSTILQLLLAVFLIVISIVLLVFKNMGFKTHVVEHLEWWSAIRDHSQTFGNRRSNQRINIGCFFILKRKFLLQLRQSLIWG